MKYLTKYERASILGLRATQLSKGAQPMVNVENITDVMKIAEKELLLNKIPFIIRRKYPDGSYEDIRVCDMVVDDFI